MPVLRRVRPAGRERGASETVGGEQVLVLGVGVDELGDVPARGDDGAARGADVVEGAADELGGVALAAVLGLRSACGGTRASSRRRSGGSRRTRRRRRRAAGGTGGRSRRARASGPSRHSSRRIGPATARDSLISIVASVVGAPPVGHDDRVEVGGRDLRVVADELGHPHQRVEHGVGLEAGAHERRSGARPGEQRPGARPTTAARAATARRRRGRRSSCRARPRRAGRAARRSSCGCAGRGPGATIACTTTLVGVVAEGVVHHVERRATTSSARAEVEGDAGPHRASEVAVLRP